MEHTRTITSLAGRKNDSLTPTLHLPPPLSPAAATKGNKQGNKEQGNGTVA